MLARRIGVGSIMILCISTVAISDETVSRLSDPQSGITETGVVTAPPGGGRGGEAMRAATAILFSIRDDRLAELQAQHDACGDPLERISIQREVQQVKREAELDWLDLQLQWARSAGRERVAAFIEQAIEAMTARDSEGGDES